MIRFAAPTTADVSLIPRKYDVQEWVFVGAASGDGSAAALPLARALGDVVETISTYVDLVVERPLRAALHSNRIE